MSVVNSTLFVKSPRPTILIHANFSPAKTSILDAGALILWLPRFVRAPVGAPAIHPTRSSPGADCTETKAPSPESIPPGYIASLVAAPCRGHKDSTPAD